MFVELTPKFLVDPTEVAAAVADGKDSTRVYLRGSGAGQYVVVDRPIADVTARLLARSPRPGPPSDPSGGIRAIAEARPKPRRPW